LALERHKQELRFTEIKILQWIFNHSWKDRDRNAHIWGSLENRDIADKLKEDRL